MGVKAGIVDKFENGYYDYLVKYNAAMFVRNLDSLKEFLAKEQLIASKYAQEAIKKYKIDKEKPMPTKL